MNIRLYPKQRKEIDFPFVANFIDKAWEIRNTSLYVNNT